eukprot:5725248-Prymnesium_polylepis.1
MDTTGRNPLQNTRSEAYAPALRGDNRHTLARGAPWLRLRSTPNARWPPPLGTRDPRASLALAFTGARAAAAVAAARWARAPCTP